MATIESVMNGARIILRDFPKFFTTTVSKTDNARTYDLPYENVSANDLAVWAVSANGTTTWNGEAHTPAFVAATGKFSYALDSRNGLLRLKTLPTNTFTAGTYINVEGYHYDWVADADLRYHALNIIAEHLHRRDMSLEEVADVEEDAMSLGAVVDTLWSLLLEYSRDIDINTPEAIAIPAHQRYSQIQNLLFTPTGFLAKYKEKCRMLDIGLDRVEVMTLRRVSRQTNRLVPIYEPREWDDMKRPQREFPVIDEPAPTTPPSKFTPARLVSYDELQQAFPNP